MLRTLDMVASIVFMLCGAYIVVILSISRHVPKTLDRIATVAGVLIIASLTYLVTFRVVPYTWMLMRGTI